MLVTCIPRASRSATGMTTTDHATARSTTSAYTRSRAAAVSSLESASSGTRPRRPAGRTHAAATSGPAQAPRPASSAPAIAPKPRRRSRRSISQSASARSSATGSGGAERGSAERRAIAVRPYDPPTTQRRRDTLPGTHRGPVPGKGTGPQYRTAAEADGPGPRRGSGGGVGRGGARRQAVGAAGAAPAAIARREHEGDRVGPVAGTQLAQDGLDVGL